MRIIIILGLLILTPVTFASPYVELPKKLTVKQNLEVYGRLYGVKNLGVLFGLATLSHQIGGALATYLFGYAFDLYGDYNLPFIICVITLVGAGIVSFAVKEKKYSLRYITNTS